MEQPQQQQVRMAHEIKEAVGKVEGRIKQIESWVPEPIAVVVNSAAAGFVGSVTLDLFYKYVYPIPLPTSPIEQEFFSDFGRYEPFARSLIEGSGFARARTLALTCGAASGIKYAMKQLRGKEDVQTCAVAAFGCGATLSLLTGLRGREVISIGVIFALVNGGIFKAREIFSKVKAKDVSNGKTRNKFSSIGLGINHHAMNFNTGFFTSNALSLYTDHSKDMKKGSRNTWFHSGGLEMTCDDRGELL